VDTWREHPFHAFLLLTERPARWPAWILSLVPLGLAAATGAAWSRQVGLAWGWAAALAILILAAADGVLLWSLPRHGVSYGSPQPPFLALSLLRGLLALAAVPLIARWPVPAGATLALLQTTLSVLLAWGTLVEPFRLQVTNIEIADARLPNAGPRLRIVQLSDLHVERLTRRERALPALVESLSPDVIAITGDFLSTSYNNDERALADLASLLARIKAQAGSSIYAVWGTAHVDNPALLHPVLSAAGIEVLADRAIALRLPEADPAPSEPGTHTLWLMGVTPTWDLAADASRVETLLADAPADAFTLLLYHTPDLMPAAATLGVDLYLAGHTHGGQWRLPGFGAILTSSRHWKRYEAGSYREDKTHLYVSRGIGMEGFGAPRARLFCPPEVVVIDLCGDGHG
jgi:predicted MPP superfamily phosphohydrolase